MLSARLYQLSNTISSSQTSTYTTHCTTLKTIKMSLLDDLPKFTSQKAQTYEALDRDNYKDWSFNMRKSLQARGLWDHVDGTSTRPRDAPENANSAEKAYSEAAQREWDIRNTKVTGYIREAVTAGCLRVVRDLDYINPKLIWDTLKEHYGTLNEEAKNRLISKFYSAQKQKDQSIADYVNHLQRIQNSINEANLAAGVQFITHQTLCSRLLESVGEEFEPVTRNMRGDKTITLEIAINKLELDEEHQKRHKMVTTVTTNQPMVYQHPVGQQVFTYYTPGRGRGNPSNNFNRGRPFATPRGGPTRTIPGMGYHGSQPLPAPPATWDGLSCWHHPNGMHSAQDCNGLKEMQRRHLKYHGIPPAQANQLRGYPHPTANPMWNPMEQQQQYYPVQQAPQQQQQRQLLAIEPPRTLTHTATCAICDSTTHGSETCPELGNVKDLIKKRKTGQVYSTVQVIQHEDNNGGNPILPSIPPVDRTDGTPAR